MRTRSMIRRMALVCAGSLAIVPLFAGAATAQSQEEFCDEVVADFGEEFQDECNEFELGDDEENGEEDGDDPFRQFCDEVIANLGDDAHEQCLDFIDGEEPENGDDNGDPDPEPETEDPPAEDETEDTTDADPSGDLPTTGGAAGLLGLGLLGAGIGLRRLRSSGDELG